MLSEAEARAKAEQSGKSTEITALRSQMREVFVTPEGNLEAREYLRPVWTRSEGVWKRVNTDLAVGRGGTIVPVASTVDLEFSAGGTDTPLVRLERSGRELSLSWPGSLPAPRLDGPIATYESVLPDVDLRMTAQEDGFTQLLVVRTAEAAQSPQLAQLRLKMDTEKLNVRVTPENGLEALDAGAGTAVFEASRPMMWDSSPGSGTAITESAGKAALSGKRAADPEETFEGAMAEPGAGESGKLAPVGVEVPAGQKELVLTPDKDVLRSDDTVYPVYIDPQWHTPPSTAWTMASAYWASSPQWKFNGDPDAGLGYCNWAYCAPHDTKRLFYQISVSQFAGRSILSAEFVVRNTWSASCSARGVELWTTKGISSSTTWNSQQASGFWIERLASESFAHGYTGCAAKDAEFNVKAAVQRAANSKSSTMTFGLRAANESDGYAWKRFSDKAYLRVQYNRAPPQIKMSQLSMEIGGTCKRPSAAARVRTLGVIYATGVTDPDGDNVSVEFEAQWDSGDGKGTIVRWRSGRTTSKKSGADFHIGLPSSIPQNKQIFWYARSYDGAQYSPWSTSGDPTGCYFVYDATVPKAPTISSGDYPASDPENPEDPWHDGVGKHGTFTIKAAENDVTKYWFGVNGDPTAANTITTSGGAAKSVLLLPAKPGLSFVTARSFDQAGNGSETRTYRYRVKAGQPERAVWELDEAGGASQAAGSSGARIAKLHGGATTGGAGKKGKTLHLDGTSGYAATDIPTVNTANGFSVSAWVKLDRIPTDAAVVAAQPGNHSPGFELYYSHGYQRWVFNQYTSDTPGAPIARAMASQAGGVTANAWTHLVGVYSGGDKELRLYVNGALVGSTPYTTAWDARRGLQIGAANLRGSVTNYFPGAIDELRIFDKPVSATEVTRLYNLQSIGSGRTARAVFPMDEDSGATEVIGRADTQPLGLVGDARLGSPGIAGRALELDGAGDYAHTAAPHADTQRSFAVSAWAKLDRVPAQAATVVAQLGANRPGFELFYSKTYNRWGFTQYSADIPGAQQIRIVQPEGTIVRPGEWAHLVGVHDAVEKTLTLYVNGTRVGSVPQTAPWYAGGRVQVGALSIDGGQLIQFFPGQIDDVRLYDRPVSAEEVQQLFRQRPIVKARWKFETASSTTPPTTPDASPTGAALTLHNGAGVGSGWVDGGLELDGVDDYAATVGAVPPVDTSGSFTVSAFAQAAAVPTKPAALISAPGTSRNAFEVRYVPSATPQTTGGRWQITTGQADSTAATETDVAYGPFSGVDEWHHLALVYDGFARELRLYVNGSLEETACADSDGDGVADDPTCEERISRAENVITFKAAQGLHIGRTKTGVNTWGEYWPGAVSDLWTFQGALSETAIAHLAQGVPGAETTVPGSD
ncbi:LamG-like jellyroll fold domain-containing protein [Streptomyces sp. SID8374]|uniref:LamG-like jellyroll fold domain-containing protein n=1 Tax=Streptomyces sp. SID8374 TaxID=2690354 RepID=UPI001F19D244|nr:LamG-like jellyroll fold domain-containing protein [Streptomyces sp. SID8374]